MYNLNFIFLLTFDKENCGQTNEDADKITGDWREPTTEVLDTDAAADIRWNFNQR